MAAREELVRIMDTFMNESVRYFTDVLDTQVFIDILLSICRMIAFEMLSFAIFKGGEIDFGV